MRAVVIREFGALDGAEVEAVADPEPAAGEVTVAIHAAPVNYVDLLTAQGEYQFRPALPYTPGKGPAGVVLSVGSGVTGLAVGDRVLGMAEYGGYAEAVAVDHRRVYRIPDSLSFVAAASMSLAFDTAWMALRERARLSAGESVLVLGASGAVGMAAVQLAKAMGASRVLAGVTSPSRFAAAAAAGADFMVDLSEQDLRSSVRRQVLAATEGSGVDVVIDPLGGDAFDGAVRSVAWQGRLVVVGFASGRISVLKMNYPLLKNIEITGLQISDYRKRKPELLARCFQEVFQLYVDGKIKAPSSATFPLSEWKSALAAVHARKTTDRLVLLPRG